MLAHPIMIIPTMRLFHLFFKILNYVHMYDQLSGEKEVSIFSQQENLSVASIWLWYSPLILLLTLLLLSFGYHKQPQAARGGVKCLQQDSLRPTKRTLCTVSFSGEAKLVWDPPASCSLTIMQIRPWQTEFIWGHCKPFLPHRVLGKAREGSCYRQVGIKQ